MFSITHYLVEKGILVYSPRERRWSWDIDDIHAENITPNVLDLLSAKMAHLSENSQVSSATLDLDFILRSSSRLMIPSTTLNLSRMLLRLHRALDSK